MSQTAYDLAQVQTRVHLIHIDVRAGLKLPCHADPLAVGRSAAHLARRFYRSDGAGGRETSSVNVSLAQCAGCLVYGMELYGLDFVGINALANFRVACLIKELTPDIRLNNGPRLNCFKSQLGNAEPLVQVIKLGEVLAVCHQLLDETTSATLALYHPEIKRWCDDNDEIINVLGHLKERGSMKKTIELAGVLIVKAIHKVEECKLRARPARALPTVGDEEIDYLSLPDDDDGDQCGQVSDELDDADLELAHASVA